jgi:segregation and condensation protein B
VNRIASLKGEEIPAAIESILFVADGPVRIVTLAQALRVSAAEIETALKDLGETLEGRGVNLQRTGDLLQLASAPAWGPYVERFLGLESRQRLSGAALESLAIVAYKQPITRPGVEAVRGVNSDGAMASLIARGLIEEVGRATTPGRPALFGTTLKFLEHFGLNHPSELPPLTSENAAELFGEANEGDEDDEADDEDETALEALVTGP